jgi:hypothetical protein
MRLTETKWGYLSRCMAVCLVLWLSLAAARGVQAAPTGNCLPTATSAGPALSADNTLYMFKTPCTTRFWKAGTIVVTATTASGRPIPGDQQQTLFGRIIIQINAILHKKLILDQSMTNVFATTLEEVKQQSSFISIGSTLAVFFSLIIDFKHRPPALMGDINLVKTVNTINNNLPIQIDKSPVVFIDSASPDWLTAGGQGGFTGGHPDGDPKTAHNASWSTSCASGPGPVVYVLDTAHPLNVDRSRNPVHLGVTKVVADRTIPTITPSVVPNPSAAAPICDFYRDIGSSTMEMDTILDDRSDFGLNILNSNSVNQNEFREHGLFVSEIIHRIAPLASIRLIRVLNDYGVGDLQALFNGFQLISDQHIRGSIVNMSLGLAPPPKCLQSIWNNLADWENRFGGTRDRPQANIFACNGNVDDIITDPRLTRLYVPVDLMLNQLARAGYHLVAAAGNDSTAFGAELPAASCDVISVAASRVKTGDDWLFESGTKLAQFSNLPYFEGRDCVGVNAAAGTSTEQEHSDLQKHAVVALGVNVCSLLLHRVSDPPFGTQGLAIWQGTSFSTGIISGNLAKNGGTLPAKLDESQPCHVGDD